MRTFLIVAFVGLAVVGNANRPLHAQSFPDRTVKVIVPVAAGGISDLIARLFGDYLKTQSHQSVIIENQSGAGGNAGFELLARSAPDGYTLGLATTGNLVINPYLYKMRFSPSQDLIPVAPIGHAPILFFVSNRYEAKSFSDFIALAKSNPGKITYGSSGVGTTLHLTFDHISRLAGAELIHVPYRGAAPALTDLIAGHIDALAISIGLPLPFVRDGKIHALAIATRERAVELPDVPTLSEVGLPNFEATTWFALFAPKGTPEHIIDYLNKSVRDMLQDEKITTRLAEQHIIPMPMDRQTFSKFLHEEDMKWRRVVKDSGLATRTAE